MTDDSLMPYGKYKGKKMANVPARYLMWLYDNNKCSDAVLKYIIKNMQEIKEELNDELADKYNLNWGDFHT